MTWHLSEDVEQFLAAAGDLLFHEPGVHTLQLSACENARAGVGGTRFAWFQEPSLEVTGAVTWLPPYPLVVTPLPDQAVRPLVDLLRPTVLCGPTPVAVQVAAQAAAVHGGSARVRHAERLFRLGELVVPHVPGSARPPEAADLPVLVAWLRAFVAETGVVGGDAEASLRDRLSYGGLVLWEDGGQPVAMAGHARVAFGAGRVGPVYTPAEHRGHGYAAGVTAAAVQQLLDRGAWEVVLFTDLTNSTSNALYPRLGFAPVHDLAVLDLI